MDLLTFIIIPIIRNSAVSGGRKQLKTRSKTAPAAVKLAIRVVMKPEKRAYMTNRSA